MTFKKLFIFLYLFILISHQHLFAQNQGINGLKIFVSKNDITTLLFHSEVTKSYFGEIDNCPYTVNRLAATPTSIPLQTKKQKEVTDPNPYTLFVIEGPRTHKFIIVYKDDIDYKDQEKDFTDLKQIDKINKQISDNTPVQKPQNNPSVSSKDSDASTPESSHLYVLRLLSDADKAKKNQQFDDAKTKYEQALQIEPDNNYAQSQLQEVNKQIENVKIADYADVITKANNAYYANKFDEALRYYYEALKIKPDDLFANKQIENIQKKLASAKMDAENRQKENSFRSYVNAGDKAFADKDYNEAQIAYTEALKIKPDDEVTAKLNSIEKQKARDKIEEEQRKNEDLYNSFVKAGDKALNEKSYDEAKLAYNEALKVKPNDAAVTAKLNSINQNLYTGFVTAGNNALKQKLYNEAKDAYNEALKIKPNDGPVLAKLDVIEKQKIQDKIEEEYSGYMNAGDKAFNDSSYDAAKIAYDEALKIKPNDAAALAKLNSIAKQKNNEQIEEQNKSKTLYMSFVNAGDKAAKEKSYDEAKLAYTEALKIKPNDASVIAKLNSINQNIYNSFMSAGNKALDEKSYNEAADAYNEALKIKPNDAAALAKLSLIEKQKTQDVSEEAYTNYMNAANKAFNDKSYVAAKIAYYEALKIKPNDAAATARLNSINKNLYSDFLITGNKALSQKLYDSAKDAYNEALKIKPDDAAVIVKLNELEKQKNQDEAEEYKEIINSADKAYNNKSYDAAKTAYIQALQIKPNDVYAANQIQKIDTVLAESEIQKELSVQNNKEEKANEERDDIKTAREIEFNMMKIGRRGYKMGNDVGANDEGPMHVVVIDSFYIGKYEVTQSQWQRIMGFNPSAFKNCANCPVENVSWNDVMKFIEKLNEITNKKYRLPTEAEWEYAAKTQSLKDKIDNIAWYNDNSKSSTHPVGKLKPNSLKIYDMLGNVSEWCSDWYDFGFYNESGSSKNPAGPASGKAKVIRGGCWYDLGGLSATARDKKRPDEKSKRVGFRLALSNN